QVRAMVRRLADTHFNLILPWIKSDHLVALEDAEYGKKHPTASWDALGRVSEEAARAGVSVQIWDAFTEYRAAGSPDFEPPVGVHPQWAARRIDELLPDPKTGKIAARRMEDVCPQHPAARRWQLDLLVKALDRYPQLGGVHIEEPGYTYQGNCVCDLCLEAFPKLYGAPLPERLNTPQAEDFRCLGTSAFMEELREIVLRRNPKLIFSANGGYNWRSDRRSGRDWGRWARHGWLDYYAAQVYVTDTDLFRKRLAVTVKDLGQDCPVHAGIAFVWSRGRNSVPEVVRQIEAAREAGAAGEVLFYGGAFTDELFEALREGPFRSPAKLPQPRR